ncbi:hypothetical protein RNJ44_00570 [Nakaseomyces bracarensis]|uniref:Nudix hydrolase domain-containing protein n=1 Tax=Nakaseomyces bracarensis TaxID=273131 RepID=A0ABR4NSY2_9SACH
MVKVVKRTPTSREEIVRTARDDEIGFSFLEIVDRVDSLPADYEEYELFKKEVYYLTTEYGTRVGFVLKVVYEEMLRVAEHEFTDLFTKDEERHEIQFRSGLGYDKRNGLLDVLGKILYEKSSLDGVKGWRNEKYAVWVNKKPYVLVERALSGVLGIITYGVHVNGYILDKNTNEIRFWIPRRSKTKPTWPYMLDNIIAGGLGYPYGIEETLFKESVEEANLSKSVIENNIRAASVVSYFYFPGSIDQDKFATEASSIVGEVEYIYDLECSADIQPKPNDGEVDSFNVLNLQETLDALVNKEFKPNCGLIMVEFLIRHGYITAENEPNYLLLINRMHRSFPFPTLN